METMNDDATVPAIAGGQPAKKTPFTRAKRYGREELKELKEALAQQTLFYAQGKKVKQLEEAFARKHGARFAIATSSGTASIHTAMIAAGISPGDEVIVTPITDMGSLIPILFQGAVPVFADVDPLTQQMSAAGVEAVLSERTAAVLAVHLWGNACDLDALKQICDRRGIMLIEDCAQAYGATYKGRSVGTYGKIGCFSLNEFKHISCGDGGMVITDDEQMAARLRLATDKCYNRDPNAMTRNPTFLAANYRMTELQGAVGLAQLGKLDKIVAKRRAWVRKLAKGLKGLPGLILPQATAGADPSWWFYMMQIDASAAGVDTDEYCKALQAEGLPVSAHYIGRPVYEYPIFVEHLAFTRGSHPFSAFEYRRGLCPNAELVLERAMNLAINEGYTKDDLAETITAVQRVSAWFRSRMGAGAQ